jgi:UDP-N-acetylglucosamine 2-epimerase
VLKVLSVLGTRPEVIKMAAAVNPYGDGTAAHKIVNRLWAGVKQYDLGLGVPARREDYGVLAQG